MTPGGVTSKIWPQTSWACPPCQLSTWYLKAWRKRIAGQLWRSASILELPKMTPRWPLTPNSWTPVLFPPPPNLMIIVSKYYKKSIKAYLRRSILWFWTHRQIHACHKLSKFSLSPFALPPPKLWFWCHHSYYILINRKLYILQKNIYFSPPLHTPSLF